VTGFPVKPACLHKYSNQEKERIRTAFMLSDSHKTVTLIMGAVGGTLLYNHVKSILQLNPKAHGINIELNVCTGKNKKIGNKIAQLLRSEGALLLTSGAYLLPSGLLIHIRGFLPNLAELMAVSDLIITKTGSCTVNEAIYLEKKIILDNTERSSARYFEWEEFNVPFVEKYGLGLSFSDSLQLPMLIASLLKYPEYPKIPLERPHFEDNLRALVQSLIGY
jgi:processive 1,2-diacylglycerol beta-glucosyltransferase